MVEAGTARDIEVTPDNHLVIMPGDLVDPDNEGGDEAE